MIADRRQSNVLARLLRAARLILPLGLLAGLAACAGTAPSSGLSVTQEAALYRSHAHRTYTAPGPAGDPWGPYIAEASTRFDVPQSWVRGVIRQESGGQQGALSTPGAMGLMQVMAPTYDELRAKFSLGDDPFDPHDNILAGTAYIRELYELYGSPAFLAAYDAGMGRLEDYLYRNRTLPLETRRYVASVGPRIAGDWPHNRSQTDLLIARHIAQPAPEAGSAIQLASATPSRRLARPLGNRMVSPGGADWNEAVAQAPDPVRPVRFAAASQSGRTSSWHGFAHGTGLIPAAMAASVPLRPEPGDHAWGIQVGAYASSGMASAAAMQARQHQAALARTRPAVVMLHDGRGTIYRARLLGLSRYDAVAACNQFGGSRCIVVSPAS